MKRYALALLMGLASATNLQNIWDEETEDYSICSNQWTRWADKSNSWGTYKHYLSQGNVAFKDSNFGANMHSIYSPQHPPKAARVQQYNKQVVGWKRMKDIYPKDGTPSILGKLNHLNPHGIKQGSMSDCWFLAGTTAIAEHRVRLHRIMHKNSRQSYNPQGVYRYYFWNYNRWVAINVDDWLPVKYKYTNSKDYFKPFATDRSLFGAWWMPLFEKAYAKLNGDYDRLEWGSGFESLRQLSGKPVYFFNHQKLKQTEGDLFNLFHQMAREEYPMVVSCCTQQGAAPDGLQTAHAYTLLDVLQIGGHKMAKIRNPWSSEGYNGKYSDKDTGFWTPAMQSQASHKLANDGIFFMPFHQFIKPGYFRSTTVAIYKDFKKNSVFSLTHKAKTMNLNIYVPTTMRAYFTFEMENPRFSKYCGKDSKHMINSYFFKGTTFPGMNALLGPLGYMGSTMYHSTQGKPDMWLQKGWYTIMLKNWGPHEILKYSLSVYQENATPLKFKYH